MITLPFITYPWWVDDSRMPESRFGKTHSTTIVPPTPTKVLTGGFCGALIGQLI